MEQSCSGVLTILNLISSRARKNKTCAAFAQMAILYFPMPIRYHLLSALVQKKWAFWVGALSVRAGRLLIGKKTQSTTRPGPTARYLQ